MSAVLLPAVKQKSPLPTPVAVPALVLAVKLPLVPVLAAPAVPLLFFFHHFSNVLYAEKTYLDEKAAGACEAIFDILKYMDIEIDKDIAECLYVGISTDTGCFRFGNTTSKTLRTAAELIDLGVNNADVNRLQFETKSKEYAKLEQMAISSMNTYFSGKCAVLPITYDMFIKSGADDSDTSALASLPRQIEVV